MKTIFKKLRLAALCGLAILPLVASAQIGEPDTIFYGQVINRTSGQIDLITSGNLVWTIARPDGTQITVSTQLRALNKGLYSYRLSVPHEALSYGLSTDSSVVPLSASAANCTIVSIALDGVPANIMAPGTSSFVVGQNLRSATYRLDLELFNQLASTSGDGIPDWWKTLYGVSDPNARPTADGWSNLQKFQNGGSPTMDNRYPTLLTTEAWVYADGRTAIPLTVVDSDSASTNIVFTLSSLPANGVFTLRNYSNDVTLAIGSKFTLEDVSRGRVIFTHGGPGSFAVPTSFNMNLCDENPAHSTNYTVWLNEYRPNYPDAITQAAQAAANVPFGFADVPGLGFDEQQMLINYFLCRDHGYIVDDSSRFASSRTNRAAGVSLAREQQNVLIGGAGNDRLVGGALGDILVGGRGSDRLHGGGGNDLFIISGTNSGNDIVEDFIVTNGDALDISRVLLGTAWQLTNYVQLVTDGTNTYVDINYAGTGTKFTNMVVTLLGVQYSQSNLRALCDGGNLLTGYKSLSPTVSITATVPGASENGPVTGQFTLTRSGSAAAPLTVNLTISGSAVNGSSYQLVANQATFATGQHTLTIPIYTYPTTDTLTQYVQIAVSTGTGYDVGSSPSAQVSIEPLAAQITIQAVVDTATKNDQSPGIFVVTRAGILSSTLSIRLGVSGTASSVTDYTMTDDSGRTISTTFPLVSMPANQTEAFVYITPKTTANITTSFKYVQLTVNTNSTYKVLNPSFDRVYLLNQLMTGIAWQQMYFPSVSSDWNTFATADTGNKGIKNLYRYAFGLNPTNPVVTNGLPYYQIINDHLSVTFKHPLSVTDYSYIPQVSDDMLNWSALTSDIEPFVAPNANTNDVETVSYRSKNTVHGGKQKQFMRVTIQPN
ncbi:MAG TPA: cadherin-like domain-containing protein [Verrucomicrobiae bacterium]|nr:cadherin-like domain-containing protein [Verrucomicrobiae bacterium]